MYAFIGGAMIGAGVALLYAPEKGEDLRNRIRRLCRKYGLVKNGTAATSEDVEEIVNRIAAELKS